LVHQRNTVADENLAVGQHVPLILVAPIGGENESGGLQRQ
jgi:hypothetical protein